MKNRNFLDRIQRFTFIQAMRRSLVSMIPILMIGSFAVLLYSFPIDGYITFITTWEDGLLYKLFDGVQKVTMGMVSVYMAGIIGYHMGVLQENVLQEKKYATMLVAEGSFFVLSGIVNGDYSAFGATGMFLAILSAGVGSELYIFIARRVKNKLILADGADVNLRNSIHSILPALFSLAVIVLANNIILSVTDASNVYSLLIEYTERLIHKTETGMAESLLYIVLNSSFWFFGIHGSDVLEGMAGPIFKTAMEQNALLVQSGQEATEIFTRPFMNSFVLMGGCGASLCLLIALILFSKRRGVRNLMKLSAAPMLFNINEILIFGLPIIYNGVFLVPFILVPVVCFLISYLAMSAGWVPVASNDIQWTTPILFNSYLSTGSFSGVILQLVNVSVGVALYVPFVRLYDKRKAESAKKDYETMVERLKESEIARTPIQLTDSGLSFGWMGKALAADLEYAFSHGELKLFYQPQYNDSDECIGVEALLRWNHPNYGWVYPPMIIKLADETGMREKLERWVIMSALKDADMLREKYPDSGIKVNVNVTGASIQEKSFEDFLTGVARQNDIKGLRICLEITEQDALLLDETLRERFCHLKELGYMLAVDDFSMGNTSIGYLTGSHFELVKLDGSLVRGILDNPRCSEIIASIIHLSDSLQIQVIAEYVSDAEIREKLLEVGCHLYQGWYYSPAIPLEEFEKLMERERSKNT